MENHVKYITEWNVFAQAKERPSLPGKGSNIHKSKSIFSACLYIVDLKPECRFSLNAHTHTHTYEQAHTHQVDERADLLSWNHTQLMFLLEGMEWCHVSITTALIFRRWVRALIHLAAEVLACCAQTGTGVADILTYNLGVSTRRQVGDSSEQFITSCCSVGSIVSG